MTLLALDARELEPRPRPRRRRRNLPWRRILLLSVAIYAAGIAAREIAVYHRVQVRIASTEAHLSALRREHARLEQQIQEARSPAFIQQEAQTELGLVPRGEIPFQPIQ